jgi:hypothetical protein
MDSEASVVPMVVDQWKHRSALSSHSSALDGKALGVLAANLGGAAVVVSTHDVPSLSWLPIMILGLSLMPLFVWPIELESGPEWRAWAGGIRHRGGRRGHRLSS